MYLKNALGLVCFLAFLFIFPKTAHAATYYVSTSGNDSASGTQSSPWRTIQKAANTLVAGDTVYIRAGTYSERLVPQNSGNSTSGYITYAAYAGEQVTIDGSSISVPNFSGLVNINSLSYIKLIGVRVINSNDFGIFVRGSNYIEIRNNYTYDTYRSGIGIWPSQNIIIDGNEIEFANHGGSEENLSVDGSNNVIVSNNHVHHGFNSPMGGEGINMKNGTSNTKVFNNVVHDLEKLAFGVDAWQARTYNIEIYNNIAYNAMWGFILESEQGGLAENLKVYNNLAYNIVEAGFALPEWGIAGPVDKAYYINNVAYNCQYGFWGRHPNVSNIVIRNNIFSQNKGNPQIKLYSGTEGNFTIDHNLFYGNTASPLGNNYVIGDPRFVNVGSANFRLQSNSPAINVGSAIGAPSTDFDGNPRPQGSGYDIGAFEYGSGGTPTPTTPPTSTPRPTSTPTPRPTATPSGCAFDINGDGIVNGGDISVILSYWRAACTSSGPASCRADLNNTGRVETGDIASVIYQWGTRCQ